MDEFDKEQCTQFLHVLLICNAIIIKHLYGYNYDYKTTFSLHKMLRSVNHFIFQRTLDHRNMHQYICNFG